MARLFLRFLLFLSLLALMTFVSACGASPDQGDGGAEDGGSPDIEIPDNTGDIKDSVHFAEISYSRPDVEELRGVIELAISAIEDNSTTFDEQMAKVRSIDPLYENFVTMHTYAMIKSYVDASDTVFADELLYLDDAAPGIAQLLEDVTVAAATSPHAVRFESDYFGEGLIEQYAGGGIYTDELVKLFEDEAKLEARYTSISASTVRITYNGKTDTYENTLRELKRLYGEDSQAYKSAFHFCSAAYERAVEELSVDTFISLLKVRRRIADTLGYDSYTEYAYEVLGHDYSITDTEKFLGDISKYVVPVYGALAARVFGKGSSDTVSVDTATLLNTLSGVFRDMDGELLEVYSYMLTYGLYDVRSATADRYEGAFTTYLEGYDAPYLFVTSSGYAGDYMTVAHEFGHFYDYYLNGRGESSLDLMEVSSQGLELLVLLELGNTLSWKEYKQLYYGQMEDILLVFIMQGFYSKFEHIVYDLSYYEITEERINGAVSEAAEAMSLSPSVYNELSDVMIPHIFIEPLYVQSYCTSLAAALEIFFTEAQTPGEGFRIYEAILKRDGYSGFDERISATGLGSPFDEGVIMRLADSIYFSLLGSHFFDEYKGTNTAGIVYVDALALCS